MLGLSKIAHPNETILLYLHFSKLARLLQKLLIKIEQSNDISSLTSLSRNIDNCYRLKIVKNSLIPVRQIGEGNSIIIESCCCCLHFDSEIKPSNRFNTRKNIQLEELFAFYMKDAARIIKVVRLLATSLVPKKSAVEKVGTSWEIGASHLRLAPNQSCVALIAGEV